MDYQNALTVSQLNQHLKLWLEQSPLLHRVVLRGEVGTCHLHAPSGHCYFTLKDEKCSIKCVMFRAQVGLLSFRPVEGMKVLLTGAVKLFERDGAVQVYADAMEQDGLGAMFQAFERLKKKLGAAGLFDAAKKRPLPAYPRRIGVVTSPSGAALQDIRNILSRRYPLVELRVYPALVQGEKAPVSLRDMVLRAGRDDDLDLLILARGGGSAEDLFCFNNEALAYALAASPVPTISAVGHETDVTICDFVADLRAPTPSAAAELAVPDARELSAALREADRRLLSALTGGLDRRAEVLSRQQKRLAAYRPAPRLEQVGRRLDELSRRLNAALTHQAQQKQLSLAAFAGRLDALSPLKILERGYSVTRRGSETITDAAQLKQGDLITTTLKNGAVTSIVQE